MVNTMEENCVHGKFDERLDEDVNYLVRERDKLKYELARSELLNQILKKLVNKVLLISKKDETNSLDEELLKIGSQFDEISCLN